MANEYCSKPAPNKMWFPKGPGQVKCVKWKDHKGRHAAEAKSVLRPKVTIVQTWKNEDQ